MTILLLAEHDGSTLSTHTAKALTAANAIAGHYGAAVHVLVAGHDAAPVATQAAALAGVATVLLADSDMFAGDLAEPLADLVLSLAGRYDTIAAAATSTGRSVMPRVAARLDVAQVSDVTEIVSADTFKRPVYAGNAIQTLQATDATKVLTIRTASFPPAAEGGAARIERVPTAGISSVLSTFYANMLSGSDRPDLTSAKVVISGGRAFGSPEKFRELILPLADRLGAAVGASRAAVDAGYAPNDWQVGQTGKAVAPDLYVACGISGAIQHLAGMKDSKIIVAINKDADAPIFQIADYGYVGDVFDVLPSLEREI